MESVKFDKKGLANSGSHKVREINLNLENAGGAVGKPRGFGQRDVGSI